MKNLIKLILLLFLLINVIDCNDIFAQNPEFKNSRIDPPIFKISTSTHMYVFITVNDPNNKIKGIEFTLLDANDAPIIFLNDNGIEGDHKANDMIWSGQMPLPPNNEGIIPGEFIGVFKALDKLNQNIIINTPSSKNEPLILKIKYKILP